MVQEINQLPGGNGVNITTQRYLTPNDIDINKLGIHPDIAGPRTEEDSKNKRDPQLKKSIEALQELISGKSMKEIVSEHMVKETPTAADTAKKDPVAKKPQG